MMNHNLMDNQFGQDDEIYLSKNSSVTNSPSPGKSRKKFPAKQIYNVWLSLKKFNQNSLEKIRRNSPRLRRKRFYGNKHDKDTLDEFTFSDHRLTASHPELSYHEGLAQLSNYQSFDDLNLITIHHNSENYISDNIEFHRSNCCSLTKCNQGSLCGGGNEHFETNDRPKSVEKTDQKTNDHNTNKPIVDCGYDKVNVKQSYSDTSTPTSFFSRFRSASPNPGSLKESPKNFSRPTIYDNLPSNSITRNSSCSTFLPKRPHSSLNYHDTTTRRVQYKQTETFSANDEDLLLDTISEQSISNSNWNSSTPTKRRDSFLLKLLKKRKSPENRNPLDRSGSTTNYEYYNQSLDEDYQNSVAQNVSQLEDLTKKNLSTF